MSNSSTNLPYWRRAAASASLFTTCMLGGSELEEAILTAEILPGALAIVPSSVNGPFTPMSGTGVSTEDLQADAVYFRLRDITINDFNMDGLGFRLTAEPGNLVRVGFTGGDEIDTQRNTLEVGTVVGFHNSSHPAQTNMLDPTTLIFTGGDGVILTVDFQVAYDVPALAEHGDYTGVVGFALQAE